MLYSLSVVNRPKSIMNRWLTQSKGDRCKMKLRCHSLFLAFSYTVGSDKQPMPFGKRDFQVPIGTLPKLHFLKSKKSTMYSLLGAAVYGHQPAQSQHTGNMPPSTRGRKELFHMSQHE